ncbi:Nucleoside-diphosphate-sugar epimerase [Filimonas lacunae]|uniref:Nucleoside-diphosphate-sugar epimerase n=1 Tax=Filimonas lacunae TaxID=477680 RepID=A0A173MFR4_9BACT|nr:NAD-dependent epimerase/dehydratase family protein [Filimonas lacunae]BAV06433.1 UDP-glucose 4-epimerase [Filimonas lacunae]SIT26939.1 Nucleoside-diphosphate-sugar epimerase [Filimonas lacunae]
MKVFLTGATGYIGSVIAEKLLQKGHQVTGLARSEASAAALHARNITVVRGELDDMEVLINAVSESDAVIHAGFKQNENGFAAAMAAERETVSALVDAMGNYGKTFIYTGGTGMLGDTEGIIFDEKTPDRFRKGKAALDDNREMVKAGRERMQTEKYVMSKKGIRGIVLRPPNVYGRSNGHALLSSLIAASIRIGAVPYVDFSRDYQWSFVHVDDLADLYVLALDKSLAGELYYAGAQSGIKTGDLAAALSLGAGCGGRTIETSMSESVNLLGNSFISEFWTWNNQSSSEKAKKLLGWRPQHTDMLNLISGLSPAANISLD